jgi:cyclic pyranopterin phosphate synthase
VVVMRGINDEEVLDFAALTLRKAYAIRFIEYMPTTMDPDWRSKWVPAGEVLERIQRQHQLRPMERSDQAGPARNFRIVGAPGTLGIINPVSHRFCDQCNRIRITAAGQAKGCLFAAQAVDLRACLQQGDDVLREALRAIVTNKPARHNLFAPQPSMEPFSMAQIGG